MFLVEFQSKQKFYTMSMANIKIKELISIDHTFKIASNIGYLHSNWASEASPTWMVHLRFQYIYIIYIWYVRRGSCDPLFFFLRRALCAVQSSCTVLFRCARPTHALHASSFR